MGNSNEFLYSVQMKNRKGELEEDRTVSINENQAALFNAHKASTGEIYVKLSDEEVKAIRAKNKKADKAPAAPVAPVTESPIDKYEHANVLAVINEAKFEGVAKINANTGKEKVTKAYEALSDEQKAAILESLELV